MKTINSSASTSNYRPIKFNWGYIMIVLIAIMLGLHLLLESVSGNRIKSLKKDVEVGMTVGYYVDAFHDCPSLILKSFKSKDKWLDQFRTRNFTAKKIKHILTCGTATRYLDPEGNQMVRIVDPNTGEWIIINPLTCEIYQISPPEFKHYLDE